MIELIETLGGAAKVAETLQLNRTTVATWRLRGKLPWKHRPAIARLCAERAVSLPANFWEADK